MRQGVRTSGSGRRGQEGWQVRELGKGTAGQGCWGKGAQERPSHEEGGQHKARGELSLQPGNNVFTAIASSFSHLIFSPTIF